MVDQIGGKSWEAIVLVFCEAVFDRDIVPFRVAGLAQAAAKSLSEIGSVILAQACQKSDHRHRRLLRPSYDRPRRRAAEQRDELAAPDHSITSSARARSVSGTLRLSVLAVF